MSKVIQKLASEIGIKPSLVVGLEKHGLCFFMSHDIDAVGAQCAHCNNVLWTNGRENTILVEKKPSYVPDSGEGYKEYYYEKLHRFMESLPECPECGKDKYDKFINNVSYPRFLDGTFFDDEDPNLKTIPQDASQIKVWCYED